jgi:hypothetical protein
LVAEFAGLRAHLLELVGAEGELGFGGSSDGLLKRKRRLVGHRHAVETKRVLAVALLESLGESGGAGLGVASASPWVEEGEEGMGGRVRGGH